jgi:hypothetical protein
VPIPEIERRRQAFRPILSARGACGGVGEHAGEEGDRVHHYAVYAAELLGEHDTNDSDDCWLVERVSYNLEEAYVGY